MNSVVITMRVYQFKELLQIFATGTVLAGRTVTNTAPAPDFKAIAFFRLAASFCKGTVRDMTCQRQKCRTTIA
jgi:hypothetical protein